MSIRVVVLLSLIAIAAASPAPAPAPTFGHVKGILGRGGQRGVRLGGLDLGFGIKKLFGGLIGHKHEARRNLNDLLELKIGGFNDVCNLLLRVTVSLCDTIEAAITGLGELLSRVIFSLLRIIICFIGGAKNDNPICRSDIHLLVGLKAYDGRDADGLISFYGLRDVRTRFNGILARYTRGRGIGKVRGSVRSILNLSQSLIKRIEIIINRSGKLSKADLKFCIKRIASLMGAVGNSRQRGLGLQLVRQFLPLCNKHIVAAGYPGIDDWKDVEIEINDGNNDRAPWAWPDYDASDNTAVTLGLGGLLGNLFRGLIGVTRLASTLIQDLLNFVIKSVDDVFMLALKIVLGLGGLLDATIAGLGSLLVRIVAGLLKIILCFLGTGKYGVCQPSWDRQVGVRGNANSIELVLRLYGLNGSRRRVDRYINIYTKGKGIESTKGSIRIMLQSSRALADFVERKQWDKKIVITVFSHLTYLLGAVGNSNSKGVGTSVCNKFIPTCSKYLADAGYPGFGNNHADIIKVVEDANGDEFTWSADVEDDDDKRTGFIDDNDDNNNNNNNDDNKNNNNKSNNNKNNNNNNDDDNDDSKNKNKKNKNNDDDNDDNKNKNKKNKNNDDDNDDRKNKNKKNDDDDDDNKNKNKKNKKNDDDDDDNKNKNKKNKKNDDDNDDNKNNNKKNKKNKNNDNDDDDDNKKNKNWNNNNNKGNTGVTTGGNVGNLFRLIFGTVSGVSKLAVNALDTIVNIKINAFNDIFRLITNLTLVLRVTFNNLVYGLGSLYARLIAFIIKMAVCVKGYPGDRSICTPKWNSQFGINGDASTAEDLLTLFKVKNAQDELNTYILKRTKGRGIKGARAPVRLILEKMTTLTIFIKNYKQFSRQTLTDTFIIMTTVSASVGNSRRRNTGNQIVQYLVPKCGVYFKQQGYPDITVKVDVIQKDSDNATDENVDWDGGDNGGTTPSGDGNNNPTPRPGGGNNTPKPGGGNNTPSGGDDQSTTPSGDDNQSTTPSGDNNQNNTPSGSDNQSTTPSGGDKDTTPSGSDNQSTTPSGGDKDTTPSGGDKDTTPSGGDKDTTPSGGDKDTTPSGGDKDTTPSGGDKDTTPSGGDKDTTPSGGDDTTQNSSPGDVNPGKDIGTVIQEIPGATSISSTVITEISTFKVNSFDDVVTLTWKLTLALGGIIDSIISGLGSIMTRMVAVIIKILYCVNNKGKYGGNICTKEWNAQFGVVGQGSTATDLIALYRLNNCKTDVSNIIDSYTNGKGVVSTSGVIKVILQTASELSSIVSTTITNESYSTAFIKIMSVFGSITNSYKKGSGTVAVRRVLPFVGAWFVKRGFPDVRRQQQTIITTVSVGDSDNFDWTVVKAGGNTKSDKLVKNVKQVFKDVKQDGDGSKPSVTAVLNLQPPRNFEDALSFAVQVVLALGSILDVFTKGLGTLLVRVVGCLIHYIVAVLGAARNANSFVSQKAYYSTFGVTVSGSSWADHSSSFKIDNAKADLDEILNKYTNNQGLSSLKGAEKVVFDCAFSLVAVSSKGQGIEESDLTSVFYSVTTMLAGFANSLSANVGDNICDNMLPTVSYYLEQSGYPSLAVRSKTIYATIKECNGVPAPWVSSTTTTTTTVEQN